MDRVQMKLVGQRNFERNYGSSVVACLLYNMLSFIIGVIYIVLVSKVVISMIGTLLRYDYDPYYQQSFSNIYSSWLSVIDVVFRIVTAMLPVFLEVLIKKFFLMNRMQDSCKASKAFFSFKGSEYFKTVGVMALISLWVIIPYIINYVYTYFSLHVSTFFSLYFSFIFTLLYGALLIIGIIKFYYSYFMVPYILAENPNIEMKRAIAISNQTMKGAKGDLFVFDLSFIGWTLLSVLTFGILNIFYVYPYKESAKVEFYSCMKEKAKSLNICSSGELM